VIGSSTLEWNFRQKAASTFWYPALAPRMLSTFAGVSENAVLDEGRLTLGYVLAL